MSRMVLLVTYLWPTNTYLQDDVIITCAVIVIFPLESFPTQASKLLHFWLREMCNVKLSSQLVLNLSKV